MKYRQEQLAEISESVPKTMKVSWLFSLFSRVLHQFLLKKETIPVVLMNKDRPPTIPSDLFHSFPLSVASSFCLVLFSVLLTNLSCLIHFIYFFSHPDRYSSQINQTLKFTEIFAPDPPFEPIPPRRSTYPHLLSLSFLSSRSFLSRFHVSPFSHVLSWCSSPS